MRAGDGSEGEAAYAGSGAARVWPEVVRLRESARRIAAEQAAQLQHVVALVARTEREARWLLARGPRVSAQPDDDLVLASEVTLEVQAALGLSHHDAGALADLAVRLVRVLPATLDALADGRLDIGRARALADLTRPLDDATARRVEAEVLARAGDAPWESVSPRAWRARIARAVVTADPDAARNRRDQSLAERAVRVWPNADGTSDLWARGSDEDVIVADQVLTDLAHALAASQRRDEAVGQRRTIDQLRSDALFDLLRRVRDGAPMPGLPVRRERQLGLVLHADTFFADGPAADQPAQRRGAGPAAVVDPVTARAEADLLLRRGTTMQVLLTDRAGALVRVVRMPEPPPGGWTRTALHHAVRQRLQTAPCLRTERYTPTTPIVEHVHARNPHCTGYDCPRIAHRCDLDHNEPWPRGPTDPANLAPRCRRDHQLKTRGLVHTQLHVDGSVTHALLSGVTLTTRPEPLPGFGTGEPYEPATSTQYRRLATAPSIPGTTS